METKALPIYGFLFTFNSNIWPNLAPLQDIRLRNLSDFDFDSDLDFDFSRSLKAKSNGAVGLPIYDILLVSNSKYVSMCRRLGVIATGNFFPISFHWAKILPPSTKNEVDQFNIF